MTNFSQCTVNKNYNLYHEFTICTCLQSGYTAVIYILKLEASVCVCHCSQRALTLYTQQQTVLLRPIHPVSAVVGS